MSLKRNFNEVRFESTSEHQAITLKPVRMHDLSDDYSKNLAGKIQDIRNNAWNDSSWFKSVVLVDRPTQVKGGIQTEFRNRLPNSEVGQVELMHKLNRSILPASAEDYIVAHSADESVGPVGYARIRRDISGSKTERLAKLTLARHKVYACIGDVNVEPLYQDSKIATALVDTGLSLHPADRKVSTYVASNNQSLVNKLSDAEFRITGEQERPGLYGVCGVTELRLEAPSVYVVRGIMHEMYPWLNQAQVS